MPETNPSEPEKRTSLVKEAKEQKQRIYDWYDENAGNVNMNIINPLGEEEYIADAALTAEDVEKKGQRFPRHSTEIWQIYENEIKKANKIIESGNVALELQMDCRDLSELKSFVRKLQTDLELELRLTDESEWTIHDQSINMERPEYGRIYETDVLTSKG